MIHKTKHPGSIPGTSNCFSLGYDEVVGPFSLETAVLKLFSVSTLGKKKKSSKFFKNFCSRTSHLILRSPHRWRGLDYFPNSSASRESNPRQSVKLHQTATFRTLYQLSYAAAAKNLYIGVLLRKNRLNINTMCG